MRALLFGGTVEGRILAERLLLSGYAVTYSVATAYGREMISAQPGLTVRTGRLTEPEMEQLMKAGSYAFVVDATHPYAAEVSQNIGCAARAMGLVCYRLLRPAEGSPEQEDGILWVNTPQQAAEVLAARGEPALLTTGSKDLSAFTAVSDYREKLWVRILPSIASLQLALEAGFPSSHIICMQGPFSVALNVAMLEDTGAKLLVTKESGKPGGFTEKKEAAQEAGADLLVIRRPLKETGQTLEELTRLLCRDDLKWGEAE